MSIQPAAHQAKPMSSTEVITKRSQNNSLQAPNLLLTSPSPRKIKPFERKIEALNEKYDIFLVKHDFDEINAYRTIRNFFLEHKEYTHMALIPDDLLVDVKHVDKLVEHITGQGFNDYPVISGVCNFACTNKKFFNNMAMIEYGKIDAQAQLEKTGRYDYFKHIMSRERYNHLKEKMKDKPNRIIRVIFSAFPLTIIRRDVMEKIEFGMNLMGVDTVFFQSCIKAGIPTFADLDVQTLHLMGIERNRDIDYLIKMAWNDNIDTKVSYIKSKPPERQEIFRPKVQ
jgi:hypothetical protein